MQTGSGAAFSQQAYDSISAIYQNALVSHHDHVKIVLDRITSTLLKPHSHVLDVACGTGKPITEHFANNGHDVTGIDHSTGMLEKARSGVSNAKFLQVDMSTWEPSEPSSYDLVFASHCFYNLSVAQIRSMLYRMSRWAKKDGLVVVGGSYNQGTLDKQNFKFDQRGWAQGFTNNFLGYEFKDATFGREEAWVNLIKSTGLEIIHIDRATCLKANNPNLDQQFYFICKRVEENSLLGPFPIPKSFSGQLAPQLDAWGKLREKLDMSQIRPAAFGVFVKEPASRKVVFIGDDWAASHIPKDLGVEFHATMGLPSPDIKPGSFDAVFLPGLLHLVPSYEAFLDHAIQVIAPTGPARILVIEAAPDNELVNMLNEASAGLLPTQHYGFLLKAAENKFRAAGFQKIQYQHVKDQIHFESSAGDERIASAAHLLSRIWTGDEAVQAQLEERLKPLLKLHFIFNDASGMLGSEMVLLTAERI